MALAVERGRDTYCVDSLQPGRWAKGVRLVAQRLYHRLTTEQGALRGGEDEKNFGLDLVGFVGRTEDRVLISQLPIKVQNEIAKDPVVETVKVTAERSEVAGLSTWTLTIKVVCGAGVFDMLVAVSGVSIELLGVS